jgi:hypothetical protein
LASLKFVINVLAAVGVSAGQRPLPSGIGLFAKNSQYQSKEKSRCVISVLPA